VANQGLANASQAATQRKRAGRSRQGWGGLLSTASIVGVYVLLIVAWEVFGRDVNPYFSSFPSAIARAGLEMIRKAQLGPPILSSLWVFSAGLLLTLVIGIPAGFVVGRYKALNEIFWPIVTALFVAPREVFIPMLVLWFGLTDASRIVFVLLSSLFPMLYNVADGVKSVSGSYVEVAQAYGASEWTITKEVVFPSIVPFLGVGLKQSIGRGLTGLIAAEFFIGVSGMGGELQKASALFRLDRAFVIIFVLVIIGFVLSRIGDMAEDKLGTWRKTERAF